MTMLKAVLVGCGQMANEWVKYIRASDMIELSALVDLRKESADALASRHALSCPTYTDLTVAIERTKPDVVLDVTVPAGRFAVCSTALKQGCHVWSEKPMASSMAEARELIRLADSSGRMFAVMQNRRYNANIRALRQLVQSGAIGKAGYLGADFFIGAHFGGFRDAMDSPLILDMAIHTFDQARFIAAANPVSVYCHEFNPPGSWYRGNASAICIFEMSDDSVFCYRGSWCAEGAPTSWEASWRMTGERGSAIWDGHQAPYAETVVPDSRTDVLVREYARQEAPRDWSGRSGHFGCLDEMLAALREGRPAETDCRDNLYSMAMVLGAIESAKTGRKVDLTEWIRNG